MFKINNKIKELLTFTDLVLLDIKHINDEKCKSLVGFSNKLELEFAKYLSDNNIPVWIKQVLIPGITDNKKDLINLKNFISSLKNVEKFEFLPYHSLGKFKWEQLGYIYDFENVLQTTEQDIDKAKKILGI